MIRDNALGHAEQALPVLRSFGEERFDLSLGEQPHRTDDLFSSKRVALARNPSKTRLSQQKCAHFDRHELKTGNEEMRLDWKPRIRRLHEIAFCDATYFVCHSPLI